MAAKKTRSATTKRKSARRKPAARIAWSALVAKIQSGDVSKAELERWFVPDPIGEKPFSPGLRLNEAVVDTTGVESAARAAATALGDDAARALNAAMRSASIAAVGSAGIVAEGDSWFDLPSLFYPRTAIDVLQSSLQITNLARFGDELAEMIAAGQHINHLAGGGVRHLLFSAGGNDVLGDLRRHLRPRVSGDHDPANAPRYVRSSYFALLGQVMALYQALAEQVRNLSPQTVLIVHGYDYALPRPFGHWLGTPLADYGFHPHWEKPLARAIIRFMIDAFNARLDSFAASNPHVVHVDLRGLLDEDDWFGDELHPDGSGATKIATKLKKAIASTALVG